MIGPLPLPGRQRNLSRRKPGPWAKIDWSHPLANGLISCWLFNEGGGVNAYDITKSGNTATAQGSGVTRGGNGLVFDGAASSYLLLGSQNNLPTGNASYTIVAEVVSKDGSGARGIYFYGQAAANNAVYFKESFGTLQIHHSSNDWDSTLAIPQSVPAQVAATWDGTTETAYINGGSLSNSRTTGPFIITLVNVAIGEYAPTNVEQWLGSINYLYHYNRCLSRSEISLLYREPYSFLRQAPPRRAFFGPGATWTAGQFPRGYFPTNPRIDQPLYADYY